MILICITRRANRWQIYGFQSLPGQFILYDIGTYTHTLHTPPDRTLARVRQTRAYGHCFGSRPRSVCRRNDAKTVPIAQRARREGRPVVLPYISGHRF